MLINPYIYAAAFKNDYSALLASASSQYLYISAKTNAVDTTLRDTTPNFTVSGWFKTSTTGVRQGIFSKYKNESGYDRCFSSGLWSSNQFRIYGQYDANNITVSLLTTATYTDGNWHHFVFIYDSSKTSADDIAKLFVDGSRITNFADKTINTTQKHFYSQGNESIRGYVIVGREADYGYYFNGNIDEISFWNSSLSDADAATLYNSGKPGDISKISSYATNCIAYWRMGDNAGDIWNGSSWTIKNVAGTTTENLLSSALTESSIELDVP
jgi:hypothetical protein